MPLSTKGNNNLTSEMFFSLTLLLCPVNHYLPLYDSTHVSFPWKHLLNSPRLVVKSYMWACCNGLGKPPLQLYIDYFLVGVFYYSLSFWGQRLLFISISNIMPGTLHVCSYSKVERNSNYVTFWKKQNYGDQKGERWIGRAWRIFRAVKILRMIL